MERYIGFAEKVYDTLEKNGVLKEFRHMMMARAESISRELVAVPMQDDRLSLVLRGQLAICIELADGAKAALDAKEAKANADLAEGIPSET